MIFTKDKYRYNWLTKQWEFLCKTCIRALPKEAMSMLELTKMLDSEKLKKAYIEGFHDARDADYLGADVFARWESSKTKSGKQ
jgi:hypothetical protein